MIFDLGILAPVAGAVGLLIAIILFFWVMRRPEGNEKMLYVSKEIRLGAMTYMWSQYKKVAIAVVVLCGVAYALVGGQQALSFLAGALTSSICGFIGVSTSTRGNSRTAAAAKDGGLAKALLVSFNSSAVMGLSVASFGLLSLGSLFFFFGRTPESAQLITGFAMGASLVALFARIGGGIFTKAADVGADLVGKIEVGIPEDDPRNPGVIADNVGDNVGDVGGMGADIFESYVGALVSAMAIAATLSSDEMAQNFASIDRELLLSFPLLVAVIGLVASLFGIFSISFLKKFTPSQAFNIAEILSLVLMILALAGYILSLNMGFSIFWAVVVGAVGGAAIGKTTEYYTSGRPMRRLAESAQAGAATNLISGLALGFESAGLPLLLIALSVGVAYSCAGLYGIALAAVGMLSTVGVTLTLDCYGPIVDNAGGIAQMSDQGAEVRKITDELDAVGNTTAAVGKGFAMASAAMTALSFFVAFKQAARAANIKVEMDLTDPHVMVGLFIGAMIVTVCAALIIRSVGRAANKLIDEIRRQFREIPGLLSGHGQPDNNRCIELATQASLREMIFPVLMALLIPPLVGKFLGVAALGGLLCGALILGVALAFFMANSGAAWDNAKKFIESGHLEGERRGGGAHQAAVVGDTVGDALKDAAGPALNILIKLMAIIAVLIAPLLS